MSPKEIAHTAPVLAEIWTEGKTDWRILKRAFQDLGSDLQIAFHESDKDMGGDKLLKSLLTFSEKDNSSPMVFIFDHDDKDIVAQVDAPGAAYKDWGNNVYSFALPVPDHRKGHENICIEMYFADEEIHRQDSHGRQLFLSSEFHENSGNHKLDPTIHCNRPGYLKGCTEPTRTKIVDADVYDSNNRNVALRKTEFAEYISRRTPPFDNVRLDEFHKIIERIKQIIHDTQPEHNVYHSTLDDFFRRVEASAPATQFLLVFRQITNIMALALQLFIITTIRIYENQIINEPQTHRKKVVPIKKIISEAFRKPSLNTLRELAEKCFYLVEANAPETLLAMKECLGATVQLEHIGQFWDDLETLFPREAEKAKYLNKPALRWNFLSRVIPEIARYASKPQDAIDQSLNLVLDYPTMQIGTWKRALLQTINLVEPIFSNTLVFKTVSSRDPVSDQYTFEVRTYQNNRIQQSIEKVQRLGEDYERRLSELVLADNLRVHIYPLLLIRDDAVFFYKRTIPSGYEYYSILLDKIHIDPTKRKFSQSMFQVGSKQELFWTDVLPTQNSANGVRANIPEEGPYEFIGRRKQINQIKDEIISIVNENGIIYGPGGIGKTALIIQLTKELFEETNKENVLYDNIIWVSAKNRFYDYIFDTIEEREPQVKSLDSILFAILKFFEFENVEEYSFDDRKELVLDLLQDYKALLIVDNFETIQQAEADKIIDFFGTRAKKALQRKPENFKIILTSRELIPSGFRQVELGGLDMRDSKRLIDSLYKRYKSNHSELAEEQKEAIYHRTKGIPILIKHCIAKIYEYSQPFDSVIRSLPSYSGNIVQFSFREILQQIGKESDQIGLRILILLEIVDMPLMIRQIADILEIEEVLVEAKLPLLANFECVRRINQDNQEKYQLNDEISLLTKSLIQEHRPLLQEVRTKYFRNFSFDKRMDYTSEEEEIIGIFEGYVKHREYADAEDFLGRELKKRPNSVLLNYYYARYLKDRRNEVAQAIKILEELRKISRNHPTVLKLLFLCYASASIPMFESADGLISQIQADLGGYLDQDLELQLEIARFYIRWSVSIKCTKGIDPFEENLRQARYKELARKSLDVLLSLEAKLSSGKDQAEYDNVKLHEICYRMAQCYYNMWKYDEALKSINRAISLASQNSSTFSAEEYKKFKKNISGRSDFYSRNPWIDRR